MIYMSFLCIFPVMIHESRLMLCLKTAVFLPTVRHRLDGSWNQGVDNKRLLKLLTQENVLVGGFFSISGYVAAYTTTKIRERSHDAKKFQEPELFFWQKVESHWNPMHSARPQSQLRLFQV